MGRGCRLAVHLLIPSVFSQHSFYLCIYFTIGFVGKPDHSILLLFYTLTIFAGPPKACEFLTLGECCKLHITCGVCSCSFLFRTLFQSDQNALSCSYGSLDFFLMLWPQICSLWHSYVCPCSIFRWSVGCQKGTLSLPAPYRVFSQDIQTSQSKMVTWKESHRAYVSAGLVGTQNAHLGHVTTMSLAAWSRVWEAYFVLLYTSFAC